MVEGDDGSQANQVWPSGSTPGSAVTALAWDGNNRIVFVTSQGIDAVNVSNEHAEQLYPFPSGGTASGVVLAPNGEIRLPPRIRCRRSAGANSHGNDGARHRDGEPDPDRQSRPRRPPLRARRRPPPTSRSAADGWLVTLATAGGQIPSPTQLAGSSSGVVAFSGAGDEVAGWTPAMRRRSTVLEAPVSDPSAIAQVPGAPTEAIEAAGARHPRRDPRLRSRPRRHRDRDGGGRGPGDHRRRGPFARLLPRWDPAGLRGRRAAWTWPRSSRLDTSAATSVCQGADQVLSQFVGDQVSHDQAGHGHPHRARTPSAGPAHPGGRRSRLRDQLRLHGGSATGGPTLTASARLIVDPTPTSAGQLTDETVVLGQSGGSGW